MTKRVKEVVRDDDSTTMKCWEAFRCSDKGCPAYRSRDLRCWLFSETHCRNEIQGKFLEKMEMCLGCKVLKTSMDPTAMEKTLSVLNTQMKAFRQMVENRDRELEHMGLEMALGLSETFEALKRISAGDPAVRIHENSEIELIGKLKHLVNMTAENIGEIVDQSHEFAMGLAEHFDVLHKVSRGELDARVSGESTGELLESLKKVTNETIESVSREMNERKSAEESLRKSEERYRDLYQNAPDGYQSVGPDGTILEVNDTWVKMFGYDKEEVVEKMKITDLMTAEGLKSFQDRFTKLKAEGSLENIVSEYKKKDGTLLPVLINATAVYDKNGIFLKNRAIVRDISERISYERTLINTSREWRETFDSMPYGVLLIDADFNIVRINKYVSTLFNTSISDIPGRKYYQLIYGSDNPIEDCPLLKSSASLISEMSEYYDKRFNKYFMEYSMPIFYEEDPTKAYVLSFVDITEIKNKENALIKSRDAFFNMIKELDFSYKELKELYQGLIHSFANAIDAKSPWTKGHSERVTNYAVAIAGEMGLKQKDIANLRTAALLHDIGKIGTYDVVLDKPDKLNNEEFALIKLHSAKGEEILRPIRQFQSLLPIIRHHHERIDGKGYPDGIKGDEIPLCARILHVADSFDSMTADRPYRPAPSKEYAFSELIRCSDTQFDPKAVEAALKVLKKFQITKAP